MAEEIFWARPMVKMWSAPREASALREAPALTAMASEPAPQAQPGLQAQRAGSHKGQQRYSVPEPAPSKYLLQEKMLTRLLLSLEYLSQAAAARIIYFDDIYGKGVKSLFR